VLRKQLLRQIASVSEDVKVRMPGVALRVETQLKNVDTANHRRFPERTLSESPECQTQFLYLGSERGSAVLHRER